MKLLHTTVAGLFAAVVAAAGAAADPGLTTGSGCAAQCIKKALVAATASSAKVEIETSVPTRLRVSIAKAGAAGSPGGLVANSWINRASHVPGKRRIFRFRNLVPGTTYSIVVRATDRQGQKAAQHGAFETRSVQTSGHAGPAGLSAGLGCSAECVQRALFTQRQPTGRVAYADVRTAVDAMVQFVVSREYDGHGVVQAKNSPGFVRSWQTQVGNLEYGRLYHVTLRATDREGRSIVKRGTFRTVSVSALVTIHKLKVLSDGDSVGRGELFFDYYGAGQGLTSQGWQKIGSGDVVTAHARGTSRPGVYSRQSANGDAKLDLFVNAQECDALLMKNCAAEAGYDGACTDGCAGGSFDLDEILSGALPGWYGTGVSQPAGHDGYFVFGTGNSHVRFLVLATVDVEIDW